MLNEQQKEWVRVIHDGKIRSFTELLQSYATEVGMEASAHFHVIMNTSSRQTRWYQVNVASLQTDNLLGVVHQFHALVHYLTENHLILIGPDLPTHTIGLSVLAAQQGTGTSQRLYDANTYLQQKSRSLLNNESILGERYIPLPALSKYIDDNFMTRDQVEYEDMTRRAVAAERRAESAERRAGKANNVSIFLAILSLVTSITAILASIFGSTHVMTTAPLDVRVHNEIPAYRSR